MNDLSVYTNKAVEMVMEYGPKLILAIVTLFIGLWIIKLVIRAINKAMERSNTDISLRRFLTSLGEIALKAMLIISVAGMIGIEMTSFIAVLGAAGLAVGLALQGSLANFAGGVLILLFKPYKVGDFIDAAGYMGTVHAIQVFNTILKTPDNKTIIVPNGILSNASITNFSTEATRRVDMSFGIGYNDDIAKAKGILNDLLAKDERVLKDPAHMVVVAELADSSVNFTVRAWCKAADYWGIYFDMTEKVKLEFDKQNISIPFPQRDVHVYNH
ncbi:MAG: mechanosensitive ion channel [Deferribacteres bacterium]|nr:mechanosensitive ion channel [candidate division KSB1 bacterium]MCB9503408.1 mechanosensitive ion channel [Deferribacteres bacterium]